MLPKSQRVPSIKISDVLQKGRRLQHAVLTAVFFPNGEKHNRFACIVSAKTEALAVKRNRIKRAFYEAAQKNIKENTAGLHVVCIIKRAAFALQKEKLRGVLAEALAQINRN